MSVDCDVDEDERLPCKREGKTRGMVTDTGLSTAVESEYECMYGMGGFYVLFGAMQRFFRCCCSLRGRRATKENEKNVFFLPHVVG